MVETFRDLLTVSTRPSRRRDERAQPQAPTARPEPEARTAPLPVAFNVRTYKPCRYKNPDAPVLLVLSQLPARLRFSTGSSVRRAGHMARTRRRTPAAEPSTWAPIATQTSSALTTTFDRAVLWVTEGEIEDEALKEAILGACGDVDPLESPDIKGRRESYQQAHRLHPRRARKVQAAPAERDGGRPSAGWPRPTRRRQADPGDSGGRRADRNCA